MLYIYHIYQYRTYFIVDKHACTINKFRVEYYVDVAIYFVVNYSYGRNDPSSPNENYRVYHR